MQRTVHTTQFTIADIDTDTMTVSKRIVEVNETDSKKALKALAKIVGYMPKVLEQKEATRLYYLDDETFFKYATIVEQ